MKFRTVLICLIALLILPLNVQAKTYPVTWDPRGIEQTLGLGGGVDLTATFVSKVTLNNVDLWIVPELQAFVSLNQTHFAVVEANTPYEITLHVSIPYGSQTGLYDGTIHLRVGSKTYPQTLKVELKVVDAAATIGPEGGVVEVTDPESPVYGAKVEIPEGALGEDKTLSLSAVDMPSDLPGASIPTGPCIDFGPDDTLFLAPVFLFLPYRDEDNDGLIDGTTLPEDQVVVNSFNETLGEWEAVEVISRDPISNVVEALVHHLSLFQIFCGDDYCNECGPCAEVIENLDNTKTFGHIELAGDSDVFKIHLPEAGFLTVYTLQYPAGACLDLYGRLKDSTCSTIAENDDPEGIVLSQFNEEFRIRERLPSGDYYIEVSASDGSAKGHYTLRVAFVPDSFSLVGTCENDTAFGDVEATFYRNGSSCWIVDYIASVGLPNWLSYAMMAPGYRCICSPDFVCTSPTDKNWHPFASLEGGRLFACEGNEDISEMYVGFQMQLIDPSFMLPPFCFYCGIERGDEVCGDQIDNNWDGEIDEGCDCHKCDTDCDGCIDSEELAIAEEMWKNGEITIEEFMEAIAIWKECSNKTQFDDFSTDTTGNYDFVYYISPDPPGSVGATIRIDYDAVNKRAILYANGGYGWSLMTSKDATPIPTTWDFEFSVDFEVLNEYVATLYLGDSSSSGPGIAFILDTYADYIYVRQLMPDGTWIWPSPEPGMPYSGNSVTLSVSRHGGLYEFAVNGEPFWSSTLDFLDVVYYGAQHWITSGPSGWTARVAVDNWEFHAAPFVGDK